MNFTGGLRDLKLETINEALEINESYKLLKTMNNEIDS